MNSSNKNKIYAAISISVIILTAASFFAAVNFLLKINNLVFNVDEKIIKEQTTELNKDGFERIKSKLNLGKSSVINESNPVNINVADSSANSVIDISPSPIASFLPIVSPTPSPIASLPPQATFTPAP